MAAKREVAKVVVKRPTTRVKTKSKAKTTASSSEKSKSPVKKAASMSRLKKVKVKKGKVPSRGKRKSQVVASGRARLTRKVLKKKKTAKSSKRKLKLTKRKKQESDVPQALQKWVPTLGKGWTLGLAPFLKAKMPAILKKVDADRKKNTVYPPDDLVFTAFRHVPLEKIKVVIVGQDPYHGPNQAMGLCFSVPQGVKVPPSLKNMYKEIKCTDVNHGDLTAWATQGVFMLNSLMTVRQGQPMSHKDFGWAQYVLFFIRFQF